MTTTTRFEHPGSLESPEMFVLRVDSDMLAHTLVVTVGDIDMSESAEFPLMMGVLPDDSWDAYQVRLNEDQGEMPEVWPGSTRLPTDTASENSDMLAINEALGYVPHAADGFWEPRRGVDG